MNGQRKEIQGITDKVIIMANNGVLKNFDMDENSGWCRDTPKNMLNYSLQFDGTDNYIEVPDDSSLDITGQISISVWVKHEIDPDETANNDWREILNVYL